MTVKLLANMYDLNEKNKLIDGIKDVLDEDEQEDNIDFDQIEIDDLPVPSEEPIDQSSSEDGEHSHLQKNTHNEAAQGQLHIGQDGVAQLYPTKGKEVYMGSKFDRKYMQITYGGNHDIKYTENKAGDLYYLNTAGWPITYNSGSKPGRSVRINVYASGEIGANKTKYKWSDNPGYLYKQDDIKNQEFTGYFRPHGSLRTHQSLAAKIGGREEDDIRSLAEMVYPTETHGEVQFNWNYAHFPYINAKVKIIKQVPLFTDNKWVGIKVIRFPISKDLVHWEMWADLNAIDVNNQLTNTWELIAIFEDKGCKEYKNKACSWGQYRGVWRIDGWKSVDFMLISDRDVDPAGWVDVPVDQEPVKEENIVIEYFKKHPEHLDGFIAKLNEK